MKILVMHGPNLNILGKRNKVIYGEKTLDEINEIIEQHALRSTRRWPSSSPTARATWSTSCRGSPAEPTASSSTPGPSPTTVCRFATPFWIPTCPVVEVHLSNIYAREEFRQRSVIAPIARGQVTGLGWRGYIAALRTLVAELRGKAWQ